MLCYIYFILKGGYSRSSKIKKTGLIYFTPLSLIHIPHVFTHSFDALRDKPAMQIVVNMKEKTLKRESKLLTASVETHLYSTLVFCMPKV